MRYYQCVNEYFTLAAGRRMSTRHHPCDNSRNRLRDSGRSFHTGSRPRSGPADDTEPPATLPASSPPHRRASCDDVDRRSAEVPVDDAPPRTWVCGRRQLTGPVRTPARPVASRQNAALMPTATENRICCCCWERRRCHDDELDDCRTLCIVQCHTSPLCFTPSTKQCVNVKHVHYEIL